MNDDQFDDLKQFIDSRISQTEAMIDQRIAESEAKSEKRIEIAENRLDSKIEALRAEVHELRVEMREGFAGVGEAIEELHNTDDDHDKRLTKLEHQAAA